VAAVRGGSLIAVAAVRVAAAVRGGGLMAAAVRGGGLTVAAAVRAAAAVRGLTQEEAQRTI
jgi:hypothetical protein